jgi:phospholipase/carboxylesterase
MTVSCRVRYHCRINIEQVTVTMPDIFGLEGPRVAPSAGGRPDSLVVFLHGYGADGNDLIGLSGYWADALPHTAFVSPNAPFPCEMAPVGRQWFSLQEFTLEAMMMGVQAAAPILDSYLDEELKRVGLPPDRLALVGFSQGTMMSLYVALRRPQPVAAIVGFSGRFVGDEQFSVKSRPPVLLAHGTDDPVIPFESLAHAERALKAADVPVETLVCPGMGHSIDDAGLARGGQFLLRHLGPGTARPHAAVT